MNVEERLRQTLELRAEAADTSPDAWAAVRSRIEQRRLLRWRAGFRLGLALTVVAAVSLAAVVLARPGPDRRSRELATVGRELAATTTLAVAALPGTATTVMTAPETPASITYNGIFPRTAEELDSIQKAVAAGNQPWRLDPRQVAQAYLATLALADPQVGDFAPEQALGRGEVAYQSAGVRGTVVLAATAKGVWYVVASMSTRMNLTLHPAPSGLSIEVQSDAPGTVSVAYQGTGGTAGPTSNATLDGSGRARFTLDFTVTGPSVVQVRHRSADGVVAVSELRQGPSTAGAVPIGPSPSTTVR